MSPPKTITGNKGLTLKEPLLFLLDTPKACGVDLPVEDLNNNRLGEVARSEPVGLPHISEPRVLQHYIRLSQKNCSIDTAVFPLGSCTMKYNPRLNESVARYEGFANIHPLQPQSSVKGALDVMHELAKWLHHLTGMPALTLVPKAGAHGELCGMMAIHCAHKANNQHEKRTRVLVPQSAHGTNPATASLLGYRVDVLPLNEKGCIDMASFKEKLGDDLAALMITNPNTCGHFERDIIAISKAVHDCGGYVYCDGANFNALVGKIRPGDMHIDAMHINLHKTFSTPHGGGGPGSGPVTFSKALAPYAPLPLLVEKGEELVLLETLKDVEDWQQGKPCAPLGRPLGRLAAFHGQMGMFVRALAYMMSLGRNGLKQVAHDAVLNANYIMASLKDVMTVPFPGFCMHEVLFDAGFLKGSGVEVTDLAKAMIDEGFHPMTVYFPLVVEGAMLIEPTETETRENLDAFITACRHLAQEASNGNTEMFTKAPHHAPCGRLDETKAARQPILRWTNEK